MAYMYILYSVLYIMYSNKKPSAMEDGELVCVYVLYSALYVMYRYASCSVMTICFVYLRQIFMYKDTVDRLAVFAPDCLYVFDECLVFVWRLFSVQNVRFWPNFAYIFSQKASFAKRYRKAQISLVRARIYKR